MSSGPMAGEQLVLLLDKLASSWSLDSADAFGATFAKLRARAKAARDDGDDGDDDIVSELRAALAEAVARARGGAPDGDAGGGGAAAARARAEADDARAAAYARLCGFELEYAGALRAAFGGYAALGGVEAAAGEVPSDRAGLAAHEWVVHGLVFGVWPPFLVARALGWDAARTAAEARVYVYGLCLPLQLLLVEPLQICSALRHRAALLAWRRWAGLSAGLGRRVGKTAHGLHRHRRRQATAALALWRACAAAASARAARAAPGAARARVRTLRDTAAAGCGLPSQAEVGDEAALLRGDRAAAMRWLRAARRCARARQAAATRTAAAA